MGSFVKSWSTVMPFTFSMMVIEIVAGMVYGSTAFLTHGWHMGTRAVAFGLSAA